MKTAFKIIGGIVLIGGGIWLYMRYVHQPTISLDVSDPDFDTNSAKFKLSLDGKMQVEGTAVLGVPSTGTGSGKYKLNIDTQGKKIVFTAYKQNGDVAVVKTADFQMKK